MWKSIQNKTPKRGRVITKDMKSMTHHPDLYDIIDLKKKYHVFIDTSIYTIGKPF